MRAVLARIAKLESRRAPRPTIVVASRWRSAGSSPSLALLATTMLMSLRLGRVSDDRGVRGLFQINRQLIRWMPPKMDGHRFRMLMCPRPMRSVSKL
jgi:hypothetical protein